MLELIQHLRVMDKIYIKYLGCLNGIFPDDLIQESQLKSLLTFNNERIKIGDSFILSDLIKNPKKFYKQFNLFRRSLSVSS